MSEYGEQVTPYLRRFIEIVASERTKDRPDLFDECVQEGMIAAWQAMQKHPGKTDTYYRAAAKNGVLAPLRGRASFGAESQQGKRDATTASQSLWASSEDGDDVLVIEPSVEAPYAALDVEGAVREAVADLPEEDRIVVFARYWEDMTWSEVATLVGGRKNRLEWRWMTALRPALESALAPLRVA